MKTLLAALVFGSSLAAAVHQSSAPPLPRASTSVEAAPPRVADGVEVESIHVDLRIDGPALRVVQRIELVNTTSVEREFDLVFPLGSGAVVTDLSLRVGDDAVEGGVYPAEEARRIYQEIVRERRDPALLEHYGEGLFRARVFPIAPRGRQTLTLEYSSVVTVSGDLARVQVPLTAFRRSSSACKLVVEGAIAALHPLTTLYSPTHELGAVDLDETGSAELPHRARFRASQVVGDLDHEFALYFRARPATGLVDATVLCERPDPNEDGYFLVVLNGVPDATLVPEPKNVVFVLDRSGSMEGSKFEQARAAVKFLVERLRPEDRFDIASYSSDVEFFGPALAAPTAESLGAAQRYLDGLRAEGGTNIEHALVHSLARLGADERVDQVVFVTDGQPTVNETDEATLAQIVRKANAASARLVAFGLGFDVNGSLLDRLAVENRGLSEYVLPDENIEDRIPSFYARMQSPLLLDTRVEFEGARARDQYPPSLGDLYGGHQLVLVGRYVESGDVTLRITGRSGGAERVFEIPVHFPADTSADRRDFVARIWAAKKIGYLVDEVRLNGANDELVSAIVDIGRRFGILTEYTSFLVAQNTDLAQVGDLLQRTLDALTKGAKEKSGSHGVSQAKNSKVWQRASSVKDNTWLDANGKTVSAEGVVSVNRKTFFQRGDVWLDAAAPAVDAEGAAVVVEEVELFGDAFFELLEQHPWLARCVARTGALVVRLPDRTVRIVEVRSAPADPKAPR